MIEWYHVSFPYRFGSHPAENEVSGEAGGLGEGVPHGAHDPGGVQAGADLGRRPPYGRGAGTRDEWQFPLLTADPSSCRKNPLRLSGAGDR